jgi:N-ethylmaleimide reductase
MAHLFTPKKVGAYTLSHRVALAPMTRLRTIQPGDIPSPMMADFYGQRASNGGLEIIEGVSISVLARSYLGAASFYHDGQVEGWKAIAKAVHAKGGRVFMQLIHGGRQSHVEMTGGVDPVAPSVVPFDGVALTKDGFVPASPHRALGIEEIPGIVEEFRVAAQRALDAGFDGVELHGANGYLLDQFLQDSTNQRTDDYGGPIENRARLMLEAVDATLSVFGPQRVGLHISPRCDAHDMGDSDPLATFSYVASAMRERRLGFLLARERPGPDSLGPQLKRIFGGVYVANETLTPDVAANLLSEGDADAAAFGKLFISNPDLPARVATGAKLNRWDLETFYSPGPRGYTDYPALAPALS